ncbi:FBD-associated F-box protein At2g26860-like [Apium graveolens]|uniref:FBD-associated F-box protein At2g26860-like n=1 Tax=Apium graveolens TaxID=4045 RepID=UPI003D7AA4D0
MHRPNDLKIKKFGLYCVGDYYLERVGDWILNVLEFDVKEIDLWFRFREMFVLMDEVFLCTCLEKLELSGKILVDIPENVKFSSLRFLKFDEITFSSYESVGELWVNCPVLEIVEEIAPSSVFDDCTFGLLKKITHVKSLSSEGETIEALNRSYDSDFNTVHNGFPLFHNLMELSISVDEAYCGQ